MSRSTTQGGGAPRVRPFRKLRPPWMAAIVWMLAAGALPPARAGVRQLAASTAQYTIAQINRSGSVVWQGGVGTSGEIFLWDGANVRKLTGALPRSVFPQINNAGQVLWSDTDGQRGDLFLWDGSRIRQITHGGNNSQANFNDRGQIVWVGQASPQGPTQIYLWNGATIQPLPEEGRNGVAPRINNHGQIVWQGSSQEIYLWNGVSVRQLAPAGANYFPQINEAGHVVWQGYAPTANPRISATQIFLWDGATVRQLSDGPELKQAPRLNDHDQVVWWKTAPPKLGLELWDGSQVRELPYRNVLSSGTALWASINNLGQVAWQSWDGSDWEIYRWNGGIVQQMTTNVRNDFLPSLNDAGQIVWQGDDTSAVYLYSPAGVSTVNLAPDVVVAGQPVTGTVTLAAPAPAGGAKVTLTSDHPEIAPAPGVLTIPEGSTTAAFPIATSRPADSTDVLFTASQGAEMNSATLTVLPVGLEGITLDSSPVTGGGTVTGTVRLRGPAPPRGAKVLLSTSSTFFATTPASVTVPAGSTTATFAIGTNQVGQPTPVTISAVYGETRTAVLTLVPQALVSFALAPDHVAGGQPVTGTVRLSLPAPPGGLTVSLSSANPVLAQTPATLIIPAGATEATFTTATRAVTAVTPVILIAAFGGVIQASTLVILPSVPELSADRVQVITLPANDIVYDRLSGRIWASVPGSAGSTGNSVVPIDPVTGAVGAPVFVGSEPGRMAVSDDGQYLYAALDGASAVRRVDLTTRAAGLQFPLLAAPGSSPYRVTDLVVVPGSSGSVALTRKRTTDLDPNEGVVVYDDGVPRPNFLVDQSASDSIAFGASPSRLYVYDGGIYHDGFKRLVLDPSGLSLAGGAKDLIRGEGVTIQFDGGRLYASSGLVVDPEALAVLGTFPEIPGPSPFATDIARGRVFFLTGDGPTRTLRAFDAQTFLPAGVLSVPNVTGTAGRLIRWGQERGDGGGMAFRTSAGQLFLIRTAMVPPASPTVSLRTGILVGGHGTTGQVTLAGPAPAGGQVVTLTSDSPAVTVPASVTVPSGEGTALFPVSTAPVTSDTPVTIAASAGGASSTARLLLQAPTLLSVTVDPAIAVAGQPAAGTLTLSGPAPSGGVPVALESDNPNVAAVPASVIVPGGAATTTFPVTTGAVTSDTAVRISATAVGSTVSATLQVTSPRVASFTLDRNQVNGGDIITGTVSLQAPAPLGGVHVLIGAPSPEFPASHVLVPGGSTTAQVTLRAPVEPEQRTLLIQAFVGSSGKAASLTILPSVLVSVTTEPSAVTGGDTVQGTVTLSGAAPPEGTVVTLVSDQPAIATTPAAMVVPGGARFATFAIPTSPVSAAVTVTVSASGFGATRLTTLRVLPVSITSFSLDLNRIQRGRSTRGTIALGTPAPARGVAVSLSTDQPSAVRLPARVVVPAGATRVTFSIDSYRVRRTVIAHLTAAAGSSARTAVLAVMPGDNGRR